MSMPFSTLADAILRTVAAVAPYRLVIMTVTAVAAAFIAAGALWLHQRELRKELWLRYFGLTFAITALQYLIPSLVISYGEALSLPNQATSFLQWVAATSSGANNVLILAAAFALLRRKSPPWWAWMVACVVALVTVAVSVGGFSELWNRVPNALISALALFTFGYALFRTIVPRRQAHLAALLTLFVGLFYATLHFVYALTPWLTKGERWPAFPAALATHLAGTEIAPRQAIDTYLIAWALLLKALLAAGAFVLIFRVLAAFSPKALAASLQQVHSHGAEFFIGEGFIRMLGGNLHADKAAICFRLPGLSEQNVAWWEWFCDPAKRATRKARVTDLPRPKESPEGWVLKNGMHYERSRLSPASDPFSKAASAEASLPPSMIVVPIVFLGNFTGCLSIEWNDEYAFMPTAVQQLTLMADLFAPAIENRRRLAAVHYWVHQIQSIDFLNSGYSGGAAEIATLVHRTLSPLSARLSLRVGFQPVWAVAGDHGQISGDLEQGRDRPNTLYALAGLPREHIDVRWIRLEIKQIEVEIGILSLAWPKAGLANTRPLVFPDFVLRRTIAAFVTAAVLDALRIGLTNVLSNLQTALNKPAIRTRHDWFLTIESAVREVGVLWVVAIHPPHGEPQGQEAHANLVRELGPLAADPQDPPPTIQLFPLPAPRNGAWKLVRLNLRSGSQLWLSVGNRRFGPEIEKNLPWQVFLERLAAAADSALSRIASREEAQRLQDEADQFRSFFSTNADAIAFFHECRNIARNFTLSVQSLQEAWDLKLFTAPPNVAPSIGNDLAELLKSAQRLYGLADALMQSRNQEPYLAYPLIKPVQAVQDIVLYVLRDGDIGFKVDVDDQLLISVPFYVAHQALLSLVMNSIDAIRSSDRGTEIQLRAENRGSTVRCHVIDDGPGISPDLRDRVFHLGVSTKEGTGGKGLFIMQNLLEQHDAKVWLEDSSPGSTVFTIAFPKPEDKGSDIGGMYESEESLAG